MRRPTISPPWFIGMLILAAGTSWGQPLTLADCIRLANSVPSAVSVARREAQWAASGVTAARSTFLPQASFTGGAIYNSPRPGSQAYISYNGPREYIAQVGIGIELDTSGRLRAAFARAKLEGDIAQTGIRLSERDLRRAVTLAFYRVLAARKIADAARESLAEARSFESRVQALVGGGEAARADSVKASAQAAAFDQLQRAADLDARLANQELASFWTAGVDTPLLLEDSLARPAADATAVEAAGAFMARPEFRLLDLQRMGFRLDAKRERAMLLPQISVNYMNGIDSNRFAWRDRGSAVIASLNVPVFDWFRARSLSRQFLTRAEQVDDTRKVTERVFSREYEAAKARTASVFEQVKIAESQMTLSAENLKLSRIRYEGGEGPALDVVAAQTQLQQARANYFSTLFLYANARADLEVAAGR